MIDHSEDAGLLRRQRRFLEEIERSIREANRHILRERLPQLDQNRFVALADEVAQLRASYLQAALAGNRVADSGDGLRTLRGHREAYDEARHAFEALQRAIERGYIEIALRAETATHA